VPEHRRIGGIRVVAEVLYVATVAALTAAATWDPNHFDNTLWVLALLLCLPALVAALPVLYLSAATAWNLTGADDGGVGWPVTATSVVVLCATAAVNVVGLRLLERRRRRRQADLGLGAES
jgi:hypothetical protein